MFRAKKIDGFLKFLCAGLFVVFLFLVFFHPIETEDVWWHLATARWMFENHQVPHDEIFTSDPVKVPWVFTQWLGSCVLYVAYLAGGFTGLKTFLALYFISVLGLFFWQARRKIPLPWLLILTFLLALSFQTRMLFRPLIFNFVFIQIFLILLFEHERNPSSRKIYLLPLLSALWFNLHMGSFMYGAILLGAFLLTYFIRFVEVFLNRESSGPERMVARRQLTDLLLVSGGHFLAFLINPYGVQGALQPYASILDPHSLNRAILFKIIREYSAPVSIFSFDIDALWFWGLSLWAIPAVLLNKRRKLSHLLLFLFSLFLFLYGQRASAFFSIVCAYLISAGADGVGLKESPVRKTVERVIYGAFILILLAWNFRLINQKSVIGPKSVRNISMICEPYNPADAVHFLKKHHVTGKVFAWMGYGGYLLWEGYPQLEPLLDGREVNARRVMAYLGIFKDPQKYWPEGEREYDFTIAMWDVNFCGKIDVLNYLATQRGWQLIFVKGATVVFVKKGAYELPSELNEYAQKLKDATIPPQVFSADLTPKEPDGPLGRIMRFLNPPPSYIEPLEEGVALWGLGFREAAVGRMWEAVRLTSSEKAKRILSLALEEMKKEKE